MNTESKMFANIQPMTKESLKGLKLEKEMKIERAQVKDLVNRIKDHVLTIATKGDKTMIKYPVHNGMGNIPLERYSDACNNIVDVLKCHFPDSKIVYNKEEGTLLIDWS